MNCSCIADIEKKVFAKVSTNGRFKKPVLSVQMEGVGLFVVGNTMVACTVNMLAVRLDGQKKIEKMTMSHTYCPWCGVKIEKTATDGE
jgi:hypothetical protein